MYPTFFHEFLQPNSFRHYPDPHMPHDHANDPDAERTVGEENDSPHTNVEGAPRSLHELATTVTNGEPVSGTNNPDRLRARSPDEHTMQANLATPRYRDREDPHPHTLFDGSDGYGPTSLATTSTSEEPVAEPPRDTGTRMPHPTRALKKYRNRWNKRQRREEAQAVQTSASEI